MRALMNWASAGMHRYAEGDGLEPSVPDRAAGRTPCHPRSNRVKVALGKRKTRLAITYRVDPNHWRWALNGGVCRGRSCRSGRGRRHLGSEARSGGDDSDGRDRARLDGVGMHLGRWSTQIAERGHPRSPQTLFAAIAGSRPDLSATNRIPIMLAASGAATNATGTQKAAPAAPPRASSVQNPRTAGSAVSNGLAPRR